MLKMPAAPSAPDFALIRREVARIRQEADHAVEQAILHVDAQHPELAPYSSQRQRLILAATRPHRLAEDAALRELTEGLSAEQRAQLFTLTLDPHFAPGY
ncbi:MAG TPA: hypothetical protein VE591_11565 [Candidatus Acidoferrum sp.]|nr:hypothetical protein [Candidatus Acidoferrum sp.]